MFVPKLFPQKLDNMKKKIKKIFLVENFLWLQNHFLENRFEVKNVWEKFFVEKVFVCKIVSSKTGLQEKLFGRKCFMVAKSFTRKQVWRKKCLRKHFWSKNIYGCKIIGSKTGLQKINFEKKILVQNFLWMQNHSLRNRLGRKFIC